MPQQENKFNGPPDAIRITKSPDAKTMHLIFPEADKDQIESLMEDQDIEEYTIGTDNNGNLSFSFKVADPRTYKEISEAVQGIATVQLE